MTPGSYLRILKFSIAFHARLSQAPSPETFVSCRAPALKVGKSFSSSLIRVMDWGDRFVLPCRIDDFAVNWPCWDLRGAEKIEAIFRRHTTHSVLNLSAVKNQWQRSKLYTLLLISSAFFFSPGDGIKTEKIWEAENLSRAAFLSTFLGEGRLLILWAYRMNDFHFLYIHHQHWLGPRIYLACFTTPALWVVWDFIRHVW